MFGLGFVLGALMLSSDGPLLLLKRLSVPVDTVELQVVDSSVGRPGAGAASAGVQRAARGGAIALAPALPVPRPGRGSGRDPGQGSGFRRRAVSGTSGMRAGEGTDSSPAPPRTRPALRGGRSLGGAPDVPLPQRRPRGRPAAGTRVVQVAATRLAERARGLVRELRLAGFDAYLGRQDALHLVRVQPRGGRSAEHLAAGLARAGHDGFVLRE